MNCFPYKAVAFDLDDTLLRDDLTISESLIGILRSLSAGGVHIIPASGRSRMSMLPFVNRISCSSLYISCNGAELWDGKTHQQLKSLQFSIELGREIAAFGKKYGCYAQTYGGEYFFFNQKSCWADRYAVASCLKGIYVGDLETFIQEPRSKILMMDEASKIKGMLVDAQNHFSGRVSVTCSKPWFLEFNPIGADKGTALETASIILGIKTNQIIAFGDGLNDLPMLRCAGRGVMMANGQEYLRSYVDDVCLSNQEDGIAKYLESLMQEEMHDSGK